MTAQAQKPRVVCITQARMGSTRLPGKVMLTVAGRTLLAHQVERLRRATLVDEVVVATSDRAADDAIADQCRVLGVACFRGSEHDVLDRFCRAALAHHADVAVRVTGDCPLIDPGLIDQLLTLFLAANPPLDHASVDIGYYPRGLDAEAISMTALQAAWQEAREPFEREHVTPFIYRRPDRFRLGSLPPAGPAPVEMGPQRWCVDTVEDFQLVRRLLETLLPAKPHFTWTDCLDVLRRHPDWVLLNRDVVQKPLA
ncbi:cytidylyltransferase domain-containing protein [Nitrospirillum viridazoti]|uniref:Spore coat polysaccharide biosynthesis protein SpsF n=1 Tax=Nitrospirillum amazonense TaxID=28077 RepID=A0A560J4G5_9PROT|nr:glycosyltransferase family protein [Nitrospirillum amazonense]TWB64114.1 spore coat polysaccharide biosynthesis protein SpsF [Nitrospirillum amazonense]